MINSLQIAFQEYTMNLQSIHKRYILTTKRHFAVSKSRYAIEHQNNQSSDQLN